MVPQNPSGIYPPLSLSLLTRSPLAQFRLFLVFLIGVRTLIPAFDPSFLLDCSLFFGSLVEAYTPLSLSATLPYLEQEMS